ncbi:MAG: SDR family oxidoreductase [Burkholderiales bacterium]|nr:SDR family oxidoreductase [Burkholderiales bacterium]
MRLANKVAMVVGAGQSPGETLGNGRATALLFAREGAKVLAVDRDIAAAEQTTALIRQVGGEAEAFEADVVSEEALRLALADCIGRWGRLDVLHNNVGISVAGGDATPTEITEEAFDRIMAVNLRGIVLACKHALPVMRKQRCGSIVNISSLAAIDNYPWVTYKASKAAVIAYTKQIAIQNAEYGIRANAILPGLMDTPMAVDTRARAWNRTRAEIAAERDAKVPLRNKQGTAWDVAHAALFLASDEAGFITGVALPVDGGASCRIG